MGVEVYKVEVGMPWYGENCILDEYSTWFVCRV